LPRLGKAAIVDTNVLLRFLMGDDEVQSPAAEAFMARVQSGERVVEIGAVVLTETVWTLKSFFKVPRDEVARRLGELMALKGVRSPRKPELLDALVRYGASRADFVDCLLAAQATERGTQVITFDETDFSQLGVSWREPG
jgi:predicted nucleic-acid-binding protein